MLIKLRNLTGLLAVSILGACATVDMADMTSMGQVATVNLQADKNVVIQSAEKLYTLVTDKGLAQTSEARLKSAANVLLKGRNADNDGDWVSYASVERSITDVERDLTDVHSFVIKTKQAATLHFDVMPENSDLRPELKSLEKAISALQQAEISFAEAYKAQDVLIGDVDQYLALKSDLDALKTVANQYGDRVREQSAQARTAAS